MKIRKTAAAILGFVAICLVYSEPRAQDASRSVWDGVFSEEQAKRGRETYGRECSKCHGNDLTGLDEAPALSGGAFLANWDGLTVGDLLERVRISMPPNKPGRLNREQIADVLAHVLNVNGFPVGKTELEPKTEVLKQIRIVAAKPKTKSGL